MAVTVTRRRPPARRRFAHAVRDDATPNALFRQKLERIGTLLLAEAPRGRCRRSTTTVETPLTTAPARRLAGQPVVVPILRAGLGFVHAAQELLPDADVGFIGIARDEETFQPEAVREQAARVARRAAGDRARPDAGHRRLAGRTRASCSPSAARRADHRRLRARRARGHPAAGGAGPDAARRSPRRSTSASTSRRSSSPASATPATASSARRTDPPPPPDDFHKQNRADLHDFATQNRWRRQAGTILNRPPRRVST